MIFWFLVVLLSRINIPGISQVLIISATLLSLIALIRLKRGLQEGFIIENLFQITEPLASVFLFIGILFRLMNWPDPNVFYIGLLTLPLSNLLLFVPKIQERNLPRMKWILLQSLLFLVGAFYTFF